MAPIREIDVGEARTRYARGWHCLGLSKTFRDGKPHSVQAFGTKLVVWADTNGDLKVLDAYCRHMGGDLSQGEIKGDDIACPFHDWRWNGSGKCADIPYARRVPPLARTRAWITTEKHGQLFVWNDPEGNPPPPEITLPEIEQYGSDEWTDWTWNQILIEGSNCREIIDNVVDMAHFFYVHLSVPRSFENIFEGHIATQNMSFTQRHDVELDLDFGASDNVSRSEASYYGPSYMIDKLWSETEAGTVETVLINCHYPVTHNSFVLQWGVAVQQMPGLPAEKAAKLAGAMSRSFGEGFLEDVEIWRHKTRIENPLLTEEDGAVYQHRRWYEQFYVDAADVTAEMTDRFELEVDTTHAYGIWAEEVAENLANQTAPAVEAAAPAT